MHAGAAQYDGAYANGNGAPATHDAVYNSLFDDQAGAAVHDSSSHASTGHLTQEAGIFKQPGQGYAPLANGSAFPNTAPVSRMEAMMAVLSEQVSCGTQYAELLLKWDLLTPVPELTMVLWGGSHLRH